MPQTTIYLTLDEQRWIDQQAEKYGLSRSRMVGKAIQHFSLLVSAETRDPPIIDPADADLWHPDDDNVPGPAKLLPGERIEFASMPAARKWRRNYPETLAADDDRRSKTVVLRGDLERTDRIEQAKQAARNSYLAEQEAEA